MPQNHACVRTARLVVRACARQYARQRCRMRCVRACQSGSASPGCACHARNSRFEVFDFLIWGQGQGLAGGPWGVRVDNSCSNT
eukprot:5728133-Prymnesium_polylepis.1